MWMEVELDGWGVRASGGNGERGEFVANQKIYDTKIQKPLRLNLPLPLLHSLLLHWRSQPVWMEVELDGQGDESARWEW